MLEIFQRRKDEKDAQSQGRFVGPHQEGQLPVHHPSKTNGDVNPKNPFSSDDYSSLLPQGMTEKKLYRKIDVRVLPSLVIVFLFAFLDRANIGNAAVLGLTDDLELKDTQFNTVLVIFFVSYCAFDIPFTVLMKVVRPHIWLSGSMFSFGLISMLQGFVSSYSGLLATRFFLGLAEAGIFACCFYVLSMWYKRSDAQRRFTFFYTSSTLAGAFGGLLASAIGLMAGLEGYGGWRWVFIMEGAATCVVALLLFFVLPDFPEDATWLSQAERSYVKASLEAEQGDSGASRKITLKDVFDVFKDLKVIIGGVMYFSLIITAHGYAFFAPTIISQLGYSPIGTQLHSVPPWACAWGFALLIAWCSDRLQHRFAFVLIPTLVTVAGLSILLAVHDNVQAQYAALFLVVMGIYTASPVAICWFSMNLAGHHRRSVGIGFLIGFGNIGGIVASYLFREDDQPRYTTGYGTELALTLWAMVMATWYYLACRAQNKAKSKREKEFQGVESDPDNEAIGDLNIKFKYML